MICVEWIDKFAIGIQQIDEQHKQLVDMMNKICQSLNEGKENDVIAEVLQQMEDYAKNHFALEEKYFEQFNYEKKDEHITNHKKFIEMTKDLASKLSGNKNALSIDAISFLGSWFIGHTQTFDREYVELFHQHGL